jgi:hypothetical protein
VRTKRITSHRRQEHACDEKVDDADPVVRHMLAYGCAHAVSRPISVPVGGFRTCMYTNPRRPGTVPVERRRRPCRSSGWFRTDGRARRP